MDPAIARIDSVLKLVNREVWLVTSAANGRLGGLVAAPIYAEWLTRELREGGWV